MMIQGKPSDFMNDFTSYLTAQNTAKRYKAGKLTPAEQKRIEEKTKEIFPDEFIEGITKNLQNAIAATLDEMHKAQEDGSR